MLKPGTKAPDFELPDQNGEMHTLKEYRGKKEIFLQISVLFLNFMLK